MGWLKIIGAGCLSASGLAAGLALGRLPGAVLVAVSLFGLVVAIGLAVARVVDVLEARRVFTVRAAPHRARSRRTRLRCRTCGRKRASFEGVYVCWECDGVAPPAGGVPQNARPS